jgi:hypothetical protein
VSHSDDEVLRFVAASFRSVWALELLLSLKSQPRLWSRQELVATLRASELVVSKALDALVAAGLAAIEADSAFYQPASRDLEAYADRVEELYRTRPNSVRRAIVSAGSSSADAFADAFKLRRESDD